MRNRSLTNSNFMRALTTHRPYCEHGLLLSTFLTHFLIPSTFQTNRHTNQITRYVPSIPRIPGFRARAHDLTRVFVAYLFVGVASYVRVVYANDDAHVAANSGRPFKTLLRICLTYRKVKWKCSPFSPYFEYFSTSSQHNSADERRSPQWWSTRPNIHSRCAHTNTQPNETLRLLGISVYRWSTLPFACHTVGDRHKRATVSNRINCIRCGFSCLFRCIVSFFSQTTTEQICFVFLRFAF